MISPSIITADPNSFIPATSSPGPFEIAGVLYVVIQHQVVGTATFRVWKSTDFGTTWTQVGGDSDTTISNLVYTTVLVGTKLYVVCVKLYVGTLRAAVFVYDTVSATWTPPVNTGREANNGGAFSNAFMSAAYRASDNSIIVCCIKNGTVVPTRTFYFVYDIGSSTAGPQIACGQTGVDPLYWDCCGVLPGNGFTHFYFESTNHAGNAVIHTQTLSDGGVLGAVQNIISSAVAFNQVFFSSSDGTNIVMGWSPDTSAFPFPTVQVFSGVSADPIVLTENDISSSNLASNGYPAYSVVRGLGKNYFFTSGSIGVPTDTGYYIDPGSGYGAFQDLSPTDIENTYAHALISFPWGLVGNNGGVDTIFFWLAPAPPPPPPPPVIPKATMGGGTYFPRFVNKTLLHAQVARIVGPVNQIKAYREFAPLSWLADYPNGNDVCLSHEWRLYNRIDRTALSCARKPDCFSGEEGARPWVEPPPGAVTFNPDKAIPLPAPAAVDVVVMSFRVPIGYDGIILAQYHAYRGQGTFVEASGDIIWRVRVNGRYLRDMGNMQLSIGSPQTLSPCPGGLWVLSGNLVEYVVSAPNGSGSLPLPGQGFILAGLHGWFFPRI